MMIIRLVSDDHLEFFCLFHNLQAFAVLTIFIKDSVQDFIVKFQFCSSMNSFSFSLVQDKISICVRLAMYFIVLLLFMTGLFIILVAIMTICSILMIGEHCIYRLVIPYAKRQPSHSCWKTSHLMFFSQVGWSNISTLNIPVIRKTYQ